ncbi:pyruvyl transferase Pvg1 [Schizosaccharomyces japonicus yFS275]|uniref:Pyruvyl transferase Pvg1 n=1 Tax=Schizosaccharomyces japonicus (strain yFS275 / FY16936) TaxID=402676 RepID=B6JXW4_SCHJY|nr:pyruvyl transferase Pvg1 [Schizosaccharomyces japonicus yFS275]EEB06382.1 pyruvyl transferase Pvg1 [Schizosaccharomyces japonicus yFS275]
MSQVIHVRTKYVLILGAALLSVVTLFVTYWNNDSLSLDGFRNTASSSSSSPSSSSSSSSPFSVFSSSSKKEPLFKKAPIGSAKCEAALEYQKTVLYNYYKHMFDGIKYAAIINFPDYPNKGDSAIYVGERELLKDLGIETVYMCASLNDYSREALQNSLEGKDPKLVAMAFQGGGNFGDLYPDHQALRMQVARDFPDIRIVSFPQSIWFNSEDYLNQTREVYSAHSDLRLAARDRESYGRGVNYFGLTNDLALVPDIVFYLGPHPELRNQEVTTDVLVLARRDNEGGQKHGNEQLYTSQFSAANLTYRIDDWLDWDPPSATDPEATFEQKGLDRYYAGTEFLARSNYLIADRLHAHVLSLLLGIPHVVVETSKMGKVRQYHYTWLRDCTQPGVSAVVDSEEKAIQMLLEWKEKNLI